jgi:tRNA(fMet)-specific endonuclease VapC
MKYLLDTNTCIRYINGRSPKLRAKLLSLPQADIAVCTIVQAEMFYGAAKSDRPVESRMKQIAFFAQFHLVDFDEKAASAYGLIRATLERQGRTIGLMDMLIAAIAIANNLILVTHNTAEFSRVHGLALEDWEL